MALRHALFLIFVCFLPLDSSFGSNGSSGIGNASVPIAYDVFAMMPKGWVKRSNDTILDSKTGKAILEISDIKKVKVDTLISAGRLVNAKLGSVDALEFLPPLRGNAQNYWVLCPDKSNTCKKIAPKSRTNQKIPAVIGSLKKIILND